jgi:branched-chain amino acid transport system substrate-binding protein
VPAIIGPSKIPADGIDVVTQVTSPAGVLTLSPSATHPAIPDLENEGLFWRTVPSDAVYAEVWHQLSVLVTGKLLSDRSARPSDPLPTVASVERTDSYGASLSQIIRTKLKHERSPRFAYDLRKPVPWDTLADDIIQARPLVLFAFSTSEFATELLPRIEQRWQSAVEKPYYLLFEGARVDALLATVDRNPELGSRILLTAPGARTAPLFAGFRDRYSGAFGGEAPGTLAEFAYDAAYLLAYGVARTGKQRPTGLELRDALQAMSCRGGTRVEASPQAFVAGSRAAARDACLDFEGSSGPLDFDNARGEADATYGVWCAGRRAFGLLRASQESGMYRDIGMSLLSGIQENEPMPLCSASE